MLLPSLGYQKTASYLVLPLLLLHLLVRIEASCHIACYPLERLLWQELRKSRASSQQGTETISPTTCKEPKPANNHLSELGNEPSFS